MFMEIGDFIHLWKCLTSVGVLSEFYRILLLCFKWNGTVKIKRSSQKVL